MASSLSADELGLGRTAGVVHRHEHRAEGTLRLLSRVQAECRAFLGADAIKRLHSENLALDLLVTFVPLVAAALCFWAVGLPDVPWIARIGLSLMIAWLLTLNGLVAHDLCVHRLRWGRSLSWLHSAIISSAVTASLSRVWAAGSRHRSGKCLSLISAWRSRQRPSTTSTRS